jgi:hypothetical protein
MLNHALYLHILVVRLSNCLNIICSLAGGYPVVSLASLSATACIPERRNALDETPERAAPPDSLSIIVAACQGFPALRVPRQPQTPTSPRASRNRALTSSLHRMRAILVRSERGKTHSCSTAREQGFNPRDTLTAVLDRIVAGGDYAQRSRTCTPVATCTNTPISTALIERW